MASTSALTPGDSVLLAPLRLRIKTSHVIAAAEQTRAWVDSEQELGPDCDHDRASVRVSSDDEDPGILVPWLGLFNHSGDPGVATCGALGLRVTAPVDRGADGARARETRRDSEAEGETGGISVGVGAALLEAAHTAPLDLLSRHLGGITVRAAPLDASAIAVATGRAARLGRDVTPIIAYVVACGPSQGGGAAGTIAEPMPSIDPPVDLFVGATAASAIPPTPPPRRQVFIHYGPRSPLELLEEYGFAFGENHGAVPATVEVPLKAVFACLEGAGKRLAEASTDSDSDSARSRMPVLPSREQAERILHRLMVLHGAADHAAELKEGTGRRRRGRGRGRGAASNEYIIDEKPHPDRDMNARCGSQIPLLLRVRIPD